MQKGAAPLQQTATVPKIGSDGWTDGSEGLPDRPRAFMEDSIQIALAGFLKVGEGKHDDDASKASSKRQARYFITVVTQSLNLQAQQRLKARYYSNREETWTWFQLDVLV